MPFSPLRPFILSLGKGLPAHAFSQKEIATLVSAPLSLSGRKADTFNKIFSNSSIQQRHFIAPQLANTDKIHMGERNKIYEKEAPQLAHAAAVESIESWGGDPLELTHLISISCTGVIAPGIEFRLMESLKLNRSIRRLGINFMGCFGAFSGLHTAAQIARSDPKARILLVCTELCSLHFLPQNTIESFVIQSLFADGSAAAIVGAEPKSQEHPLWEIAKHSSLALKDSLDAMTWVAGETCYEMTLSPTVPRALLENITPFIATLLEDKILYSDCTWAIHPGGKVIVQAFERHCGLVKEQTSASWKTLSNYGNMSSATFLYVLDAVRREGIEKEWTVGLGFGPGLSIEGILLKRAT